MMGWWTAIAMAALIGGDGLLVVPAVVAGDDGKIAEASVAAAARDAAGRFAGVTASSAAQAATEARRCGSNLYCIAGAGARVGARFTMVVNVNLAFPPTSVAVVLVDRRTGGAVARASSAIGDEGPVEAVRAQVAAALSSAGFERAAELSLSVTPDAAQLRLSRDKDEVSVDPGVARVSAGPVIVRATCDGYEPAQLELTAVSGERRDVALVLDEAGSVAASPWLWVGIGAGVAVVAGVVAAVLARPRAERCVCITSPNAPCPPCS